MRRKPASHGNWKGLPSLRRFAGRLAVRITGRYLFKSS
jgi:hypothetical protein